MNSINQQQPEKNHEDLNGAEAYKKIKELVEKADTCFFCTANGMGMPFQTRPMAIQKVSDNATILFLSAIDSNMNAEINADEHVQLLFQGSAHAGFLSLHGVASISQNKETIRELWKPLMKTWFTEGENDPRITVIKFETTGGYYWDNKHGNAIALLKIAVGAMIGKTLDDSIEGKLAVVKEH